MPQVLRARWEDYVLLHWTQETLLITPNDAMMFLAHRGIDVPRGAKVTVAVQTENELSTPHSLDDICLLLKIEADHT